MATRSRNWCFTINNWTDDDLRTLEDLPDDMVVGAEVGENGTPHLQGVIHMSQSRTLSATRARLGGRAHVEPMRGTWTQAADYCRKDGDVRIDRGTGPRQGARVDLEAYRDDVAAGANDWYLVQNHLSTFARYPRLADAVRKAATETSVRDYRKLKTVVLYGPGGTGKTRAATQVPEDTPYLWKDYARGWWDGYRGQRTLILDEFAGQLDWNVFLGLTDGQQHRLDIKNSHAYAHWDRVIITSNVHPNDWYANKDLGDPEFNRRITKVVDFLTHPYPQCKCNDCTEWQSWFTEADREEEDIIDLTQDSD